MAENEGIGRLQKLDSGQPNRVEICTVGLSIVITTTMVGGCGFRLANFCGDEKSNVMAGICFHDLSGVYRPVKSVDFSIWVLDY